MKKLLFIAPVWLLSSCGHSPQQTEDKKSETERKKKSIVMKGSDTVLPLAQKAAEWYLKEHPEANITVVGGGSGVGISSLMEGTTDIAMSSRPLKTDEKLKFKDKGMDVVETIIAYDALAVIIHPENPVTQLTRQQISDIFTGKITNWKMAGGPDLKIIVYARESSSGTYEFFKEHVMDKKNYASEVLNMPATGAIIQSVSQTKGAISYVGLAYETTEVKHLAVSYDDGKNYYIPSYDNVKNNTYPIARPLYLFYDLKNQEKVKFFIDFLLSEEGQKIVKEVGYITR